MRSRLPFGVCLLQKPRCISIGSSVGGNMLTAKSAWSTAAPSKAVLIPDGKGMWMGTALEVTAGSKISLLLVGICCTLAVATQFPPCEGVAVVRRPVNVACGNDIFKIATFQPSWELMSIYSQNVQVIFCVKTFRNDGARRQHLECAMLVVVVIRREVWTHHAVVWCSAVARQHLPHRTHRKLFAPDAICPSEEQVDKVNVMLIRRAAPPEQTICFLEENNGFAL